jgi:5'(3')-deoxyribonucleotidase
MKKQIFMDLDCTVVDLPSIILEHYNHDFKDNKTKINKYNFGDLDKAPYPYFEQLLSSKGLFYNAPPIPNAIETINKLLDEGYECFIISNPVHNKYCAFEKYQFINIWLPKFNQDNIIFTGNKGIFSNKNRILLDDQMNYLTDFRDYGEGISIAFEQPWNKKEWKGLTVSDWNEFHELVKILDN